MERYAAARPDVFFTGPDGSLRSNRVLAQLAGQYAIDMFIGSSLQIDGDANSSTVTDGRLSGFGGAPNMGHDPHGRRHSSTAWLDLAHGDGASRRGRKLVVQMAQTFRAGGVPTFVETLDAVEVGKAGGHAAAAGDDLRRRRLPRGHRGGRRLPVQGALAGRPARGAGRRRRRHAGRPWRRRATTEALRRDGLVAFPEDLGVETRLANRSLLAARSIDDLVAWSGGLYDPPAQFRGW